MKLFRKLSFLMAILPIAMWSANFDSTVHFQIGTKFPEETSYMKITGNFYDDIPESPFMWVISPKIFLNPTVPMDFAMSAGVKCPLGDHVIGTHVFGHFHNFGDFPVNQYGHTFEVLHDKWEAKVNYYYPAKDVFPLSTGVKSSHRIDSEFAIKTPKGSFSLGPMYEFDGQKFGMLAKVTAIFEKTDIGIEVCQPAGGSTMTSLFCTFKFPNKNKPKISPKGNNSCHYTGLSIEGPTSYSTQAEKPKVVESNQ